MSDTPTELEKFVAEHQEFFDRMHRIMEETDAELDAIAAYKAAHPETNDTEYQLKVVEEFLAENPDQPTREVVPKDADAEDE